MKHPHKFPPCPREVESSPQRLTRKLRLREVTSLPRDAYETRTQYGALLFHLDSSLFPAGIENVRRPGVVSH